MKGISPFSLVFCNINAEDRAQALKVVLNMIVGSLNPIDVDLLSPHPSTVLGLLSIGFQSKFAFWTFAYETMCLSMLLKNEQFFELRGAQSKFGVENYVGFF